MNNKIYIQYESLTKSWKLQPKVFLWLLRTNQCLYPSLQRKSSLYFGIFQVSFFFRLHYTQIFTLLALTNEKKLNMYIQTMYTKVSTSLQNEEYAERFGNIVLEYIVFVCTN